MILATSRTTRSTLATITRTLPLLLVTIVNSLALSPAILVLFIHSRMDSFRTT